jgi:electron transfer flavoprotein alpha subunit
MPNVLIVAEKRDQGLHPIVFELMGVAQKVVQAEGGQIHIVLPGHNLADLGQSLLSTGADGVHLVEDPLLEDYSTDAYVNGLAPIVGSLQPDIVLLGQTPMGRDLAPRLAFRLDGAIAMDCLNLGLDPSTQALKVTRPVYGGSILADYQFADDIKPRVVTIRSKACEPVQPTSQPKGRVSTVSAGLDGSQVRTRTIEKISLLKEGEARLEDADIIVSGGWGLGEKENYHFIEDLATAIGGVPGASRPICDLEWTHHSRHIGLTGKVVAPTLYVAVAISGAMHHIAGCAGSKVIVGINIDPKASIFKYAKYGIVGDYAQIVPALIRQLEGRAS